MKIKSIHMKKLLFGAMACLALPTEALINPGPGDKFGDRGCESCDTASTGNTSSRYASMDWSINVGMAKYEASNDYLNYFRIAVTEGTQQGRSIPRNLSSVFSYHNGGGVHNRQPMRLSLSSPEIGANLRNPASLTYIPTSSAEIIEKNGFVNQVLTDDALTHVDKLTDGFKIRVWNRSLITLGGKVNGLYPVPPAADEPLTEVTFAKPATATDDHELTITEIQNFGATTKTTTQHIKEVMSTTTGKPETMTIKTYDGDDITAASKLLTIEKLTYSNRGAKAWDYHIERKVWTASTAVDGTMTPPTQTSAFLTRHDYEQYKDFSTGAAGGGEGARRIISNTTAYGTTEASETAYTYIDSPSNTHVHGRLQSITRPDGSWEYYEYSDSPWASLVSETKYSSWKDVTINDRANARKVTTTVESGKISRITEIAGQQVAKQETSVSTNTAGESLTITKNWDGTAWHTSTSCRYPQGASLSTAGRLKWVEHSDGTATTYSYAVANGDTTVTIRTGAGNRNGITSGTKTVKVLNGNYLETSVTVTDIASTLQVSSWAGSQEDNKGRPQTKTFSDGTTSSTVYGCCGVSDTTDRSGATAEYFRDALKRVYRVRRQASSTAPTIDTTTAYTGLTTSTSRDILNSTDSLFVSETTRTLSGLTITTKSPDADEDGTKETTTRKTVNNTTGGRTITITYPDNTTTSSVTYLDGRTKSSTDQATNTTTYNYGTHNEDGGGTWTQVSAPGGTQWSKSYTDHLGRRFKTIYPDGAVAKQTYYLATSSAGSRGKLASSTDPDENATSGTGTSVSYAYNAEGQRTTTTEAIADSKTRTTVTDTSVVNDTDLGISLKTTTTVNNKLISTSYRSVDGFESKSVSLAGTSSSIRTIPADGAWTVTSITPGGQSSKQTYTKGRLDRSESFDNSATPVSIAYTTYQYDNFGRTTSTVDSRTGTTSVDGYTDAGQPTSVTTNNTADSTSYDYDEMGRRIKTTLPDNSTTHTSYTSRGQVLATWGSQTYARLYQYDAQGRMSELRTYQDLAHGTEPSISTSGAATTEWLYDSQRGWLTEKNYDGETDNGTADADYTYTLSGRLKTRTWERGVTTTYTYDQGSLEMVDYSDSTADVTYTYDNYGRPLTVTQSGNTHTYAYDANTMVLDTETIAYDTDGNGTADFTRVLDRSQDSLMRPNGIEISGEYAVSYGYDSAGRLQHVHPAASLPTDPSTSDFTYSYETNSFGLVKTVVSPAHTVTNTYETHRNVLTIKENSVPSVSSVVSNFTYTVNNLGQRTSLTTSGSAFATAPVWAWSYNGLGELIEAADSSTANNDRAYQYDGIGNRQKTVNGLIADLPTTPNYTANAINQYTSVPSLPSAPLYDLDGNATDYPLPVAATVNSKLIWDAENRLIEVKNGSNVTLATYQYDYLGRRISKTAGSITTRYIYDGWNPVVEYAGTTLSKSYTWGMDLSGSMQGAGGVGGLLAVTEHGAQSTGHFYPTYDGNGNVSEYLNASGVVQAHYEYDAFGNTLVSSGAKVNDFAHRFSTKPLDAETGLYYYGYRYYDPVTGRWSSRDRIEEYGGFNLYGFMWNDAVNWVDVLGEKNYVDPGEDHEDWKRRPRPLPRPPGGRPKPRVERKVVNGFASAYVTIFRPMRPTEDAPEGYVCPDAIGSGFAWGAALIELDPENYKGHSSTAVGGQSSSGGDTIRPDGQSSVEEFARQLALNQATQALFGDICCDRDPTRKGTTDTIIELTWTSDGALGEITLNR